MDYPTAEEEFELLYGDELELLNEQDDFDTQPRISYLPNQSTPSSNNKRQSTPLTTLHNKAPISPALSQISRENNRQLFDGPAIAARLSPTPFCEYPKDKNDPLSEMQNIGLYHRKRRLELDLFGDIYDIDSQDPSNAKKQKSEEERDQELIAKILEARQKYQAQLQPMKNSGLNQLEALRQYKKQNLSASVPKWPFVTLLMKNGEKAYVRTHSEEFEANELAEINLMTSSLGSDSLLGDLKQDVWKKANELVAKRMVKFPSTPPIFNHFSRPFEYELWVEKYKPKAYIDLLSDETTNRNLLQWLKLWDKVVFGKEVKIHIDAKPGTISSFNKKTGKFEKFGGWLLKKNKLDLRPVLDENNRPVQPIALLAGPPGLGKTTLAHIIARHAGYEVCELNASDDRSPEAFRLALENGTQMKSVLNPCRRPNCMILDEIDGAPLASIEFLLRFASTGVSQKYTKKTMGSDKKGLLKRPIICICNDLYAPALRQLRQVAFVVNFPQLDSERLADRLYDIADLEGIDTDLTTLMALADKTGNDVRSCLSFLQFHTGQIKPIKMIDVLRSNVGVKDHHKGLFATWSAIFQIQRPKKMLTEDDNHKEIVTMSDTSLATRMKFILETVYSAGDNERLMQGVFENYLQQKLSDMNLYNVADGASWFCFNDRMQTKINHLQNYSVYPYLAFTFVQWHFLFASMAWPKLHFPNKGFEANQKLQTSNMVLNQFRKGIEPSTRGVGDGVVLLLDCVPLIRHILKIKLQSVSSHLLTNKERDDIKHGIEIMLDLGLSYTQLRLPDGSYNYQIVPDIDNLGAFEVKSVGHKDVPEQARQMVYYRKQVLAREVDVERMRRVQPKVIDKRKFAPNPITKQPNPTTSSVPNHLQKLKPKAISGVKEMTFRDFFGRIVTKPFITDMPLGGSNEIVKSPIWYRYKEGYNNAVRKDLSIMDLK